MPVVQHYENVKGSNLTVSAAIAMKKFLNDNGMKWFCQRLVEEAQGNSLHSIDYKKFFAAFRRNYSSILHSANEKNVDLLTFIKSDATIHFLCVPENK